MLIHLKFGWTTHTFPGKHNLPKLIQKETENLNCAMSITETKSEIKLPQQRKFQAWA